MDGSRGFGVSRCRLGFAGKGPESPSLRPVEEKRRHLFERSELCLRPEQADRESETGSRGASAKPRDPEATADESLSAPQRIHEPSNLSQPQDP